MSIVGIGAVLCGQKTCRVLMFFITLSVSTRTVQYISGGVIPLIFASFPCGGAFGCPLDSTGLSDFAKGLRMIMIKRFSLR
jgi:hypothetical protein